MGSLELRSKEAIEDGGGDGGGGGGGNGGGNAA
jgi:hypothetical protein